MRNSQCRLAWSDTALSKAMEIAWNAGVCAVFLQEWRCVECQCRAIISAQTKIERNTLTADKWWSALSCAYFCPSRWCRATVAGTHENHPQKRGSAQRQCVQFFVESRLLRTFQRTFVCPYANIGVSTNQIFVGNKDAQYRDSCTSTCRTISVLEKWLYGTHQRAVKYYFSAPWYALYNVIFLACTANCQNGASRTTPRFVCRCSWSRRCLGWNWTPHYCSIF